MGLSRGSDGDFLTHTRDSAIVSTEDLYMVTPRPSSLLLIDSAAPLARCCAFKAQVASRSRTFLIRQHTFSRAINPSTPSHHPPSPAGPFRSGHLRLPALHSDMGGTIRHEKTDRGGGQRGGRGGRSGGGARPPASREVVVSKALSFLLRHGAKGEGIELDDGGWANLADVVSATSSSFWYCGVFLPFRSQELPSCLVDVVSIPSLERCVGADRPPATAQYFGFESSRMPGFLACPRFVLLPHPRNSFSTSELYTSTASEPSYCVATYPRLTPPPPFTAPMAPPLRPLRHPHRNPRPGNHKRQTTLRPKARPITSRPPLITTPFWRTNRPLRLPDPRLAGSLP